ncbi:diguanylate cyclase [Pseudoneobacillus sp. C159]
MEYFSQAVLDALLDQIAVLDKDGNIIAINKSWVNFSIENNGDLQKTGIGNNYLNVCPKEVRVGILHVLTGTLDHFSFEYTCHSSNQLRWFLLRVTPIKLNQEEGVVVSHVDVTKNKQQLIELEDEKKSLEKTVYTDSLTKVFNRRYFNRQYKKVFKQYSEKNMTFSLLVIDIDYFKQYNDTYGHKKGDECLIKVANTLVRGVRTKDIVCRIGGEEFCVILPNTNKDEAISLAERLCKKVQGLKIPHSKSNACRYVTVSIGVSSPSYSGDSIQVDQEKIFIFADQALYQSKKNGRNQVNFYN